MVLYRFQDKQEGWRKIPRGLMDSMDAFWMLAVLAVLGNGLLCLLGGFPMKICAFI